MQKRMLKPMKNSYVKIYVKFSIENSYVKTYRKIYRKLTIENSYVKTYRKINMTNPS